MFWNRINQIAASDAKRLIEEGALVIDVRHPEDFEKSRIDGAISMARNRVEEAVTADDKSKPIICYCYRGVSSRAACKKLQNAGFTQVFNLKGGYAAWRKFRDKG